MAPATAVRNNETLSEADTPYYVDFTPDPELYPFTSKWFDSSVGRVHYIDEGEGRPLLLMHGNPDWSFLYRKMIPFLAQDDEPVAAANAIIDTYSTNPTNK